MSVISSYTAIDTHPTQTSIADHLLSPLYFCGRQWHIVTEPLVDENIFRKAQHVAGKILSSLALVFAIPLACLPALIGSLLKVTNHHIDIIECDVDPLTRNRCMELGIGDQRVRDALIAGQICSYHNNTHNPLKGLFSSLFVSQGNYHFENSYEVPSTFLTFTAFHSSFSNFVDHIVGCFKITTSEERKRVSLLKLSDLALGIARSPINPMQPFQDRFMVKNFSKVYLTFSNDLRKMEVRASS